MIALLILEVFALVFELLWMLKLKKVFEDGSCMFYFYQDETNPRAANY